MQPEAPKARKVPRQAEEPQPGGQARQERLVSNLAAGRTTLKKYKFSDVKVTPGMKIRVGVKELNGSRILNDEVEVQ